MYEGLAGPVQKGGGPCEFYKSLFVVQKPGPLCCTKRGAPLFYKIKRAPLTCTKVGLLKPICYKKNPLRRKYVASRTLPRLSPLRHSDGECKSLFCKEVKYSVSILDQSSRTAAAALGLSTRASLPPLGGRHGPHRRRHGPNQEVRKA